MTNELKNHKIAMLDVRKFIETKKSGFVYLRGRRRVGKTTLLRQLQKNQAEALFYFTGALDEKDQKSIERFCAEWSQFSKSNDLLQLKSEYLNWKSCFTQVLKYAITCKSTFTIVFDEVQWLAKNQNGFVGLLKEIWIDWEKSKKIKVIVCGSSNKFFFDKTGGEEQILRGLRTHADIWLYEASPTQLKKHYAEHWTHEQIAFFYFLVGGIPYYWNQLSDTQNFIQSVNRGLFHSSSIFLNEIDELLRIEFNKAGTETIKKIVRAITLHGATEEKIATKSQLSQSTLNESIQKMLDFKLLFEKKNPFSRETRKRRGSEYYIKDFLLNSYSKIFFPLRNNIKNNDQNQLILLSLLEGKRSLYIPDLTGHAFERFIQLLIEQPRVESRIHKLMHIENISFDVTNFQSKELEIDLVLHETSDDVIRLVECKWTRSQKLIVEEIAIIQSKIAKLRDLYKFTQAIETFLITNCTISKATTSFAKKNKITLITLQELF